MDEEFEQELYEEPDYNIWETNRVYEDMAIERQEAEAEAEAERIEAEVRPVVESVVAAMPWAPLDLVETIATRIIEHQREVASAGRTLVEAGATVPEAESDDDPEPTRYETAGYIENGVATITWRRGE